MVAKYANCAQQFVVNIRGSGAEFDDRDGSALMQCGKVYGLVFTCLLMIGVAAVHSRVQADVGGPSFNCKVARSPAERTICSSPYLSRLDRELAQTYKKAKARVARHGFIGDRVRQIPAEWFKQDNKREWRRRERACRDDFECLERWYWKRKAVLSWIAYSKDSLGDSGISEVTQLESGQTIIAYGMATHKRNVLYNPDTDTFKTMPDGDIKILSEKPFRYLSMAKKSYFNNVGGAFWFNAVRDEDGRLLSLEPSDPQNAQCFSKREFASRTSYALSDLALVPGNEVCVSG
jgi:uncharacterized protein